MRLWKHRMQFWIGIDENQFIFLGHAWFMIKIRFEIDRNRNWNGRILQNI